MTPEQIRNIEINCSGPENEVKLQVSLEKFKMLRELTAQIAEQTEVTKQAIAISKEILNTQKTMVELQRQLVYRNTSNTKGEN